ncbi:sulfatase [Lentisphaera marina]|uniref:sulfatase n=1 Tax=Lentisphaera marina TaxID=1111041 RepID=UPI00236588C9|nr:sulfatase [Lentisphaera marina]MDD7985171.1 sulfatase [Lentisphaera marina]
MKKSILKPLLSLYICFIPFCLSLGFAAETKPNVLMLVIDDLNDWIGPLKGHPQVKTPAIDSLAARGMNFTNAHCQTPLCNPSRTSFMTGLRPSSSGVYGLRPWFRNVKELKDYVTLPQYFSKAEYTTYTIGKIYHAKVSIKDEFDHVGKAKKALRAKTKHVKTPRGGNGMDWGLYPYKDSDHKDWKTADWAIKTLNSKPKGPFFMSVGFSLPHVPLRVTQKWLDLYPLDQVQLPAMIKNDREDTPRFSWYLHWKLPEPRQKFLIESNEQHKIVQAYLGSVSYMDHQVGRVLNALKKNGYLENTIVVLFSDHGYHLGEKEITGKNTLWEQSTRVPLIFAGPGINKGECQEPVELLDIYPTLAEAAGLNKPSALEGLSLMAQINNPSTERERPAITTHNHDNHSIRTKQWRFIQYADGSRELYNMQKDPNEFTNLAKLPEYAPVIKEHLKWIPKINRKPVEGSSHRLLTYENGILHWEGEEIKKGAEIPE